MRQSIQSIQQLPTEKLRVALGQPNQRHSETAISGLVESTKEGILSPLHVIGPTRAGTYTIGDGHRRWQCAVTHNFKLIPCIVHPPATDPDTLWATLNAKTRGVTGPIGFIAGLHATTANGDLLKLLSQFVHGLRDA